MRRQTDTPSHVVPSRDTSSGDATCAVRLPDIVGTQRKASHR